MGAPRVRWGDALLNVALVAGGLVVAVLLYGLASRTLTPRTVPVRADVYAASDTTVTGERVQVEVFNASARDGLGARAAAHLRRLGFDVLGPETGSVQDTTAIRVRRGTAADGQHVAGALGVAPRAVAVDTSDARDYEPHVIVRLGRDYPALAPFDL